MRKNVECPFCGEGLKALTISQTGVYGVEIYHCNNCGKVEHDTDPGHSTDRSIG